MGLLFTLVLGALNIPIILALIPAFILMGVIYRQDKIEPEPPGLLVRLFLLGALSTVSAAILERILSMLLDLVYPNNYTYLYNFIMYFLIVAVVEEGGKYVFLKTTWNHPAFNYLFDAVVYGVTVSLGFAAAENLLYVFYYGVGITPLRAVTAVPLHCVCGVFMGHYYGMAAACDRFDARRERRLYGILSVLVPVLIHGFYDFAATTGTTMMSLAFYAFIVAIDIIAILSVKKYAAEDTRI